MIYKATIIPAGIPYQKTVYSLTMFISPASDAAFNLFLVFRLETKHPPSSLTAFGVLRSEISLAQCITQAAVLGVHVMHLILIGSTSPTNGKSTLPGTTSEVSSALAYMGSVEHLSWKLCSWSFVRRLHLF